MPYFRYQFRDSTGNLLEGTLMAPTEQEAVKALQQRGISNPIVMMDTMPPINQSSAVYSSAPIAQAAAVAAQPLSVVRTKRGTDQDRFFLFSQAAERLKAGINPSICFGDLSRYERSAKFRDSLQELSTSSADGKPLSRIFERYPDLYPAHVAGMVRAGEEAGFLPDAFRVLSDQSQEAHKFKRFHWFVWLVSVNALLSVPLIFAFRKAILETYKKSEEGMSIAQVVSIFMSFLGNFFLPMVLATTVIALILRWFFSRPELTYFRHKVGLNFPHYGPRARNENVRYFTYTLSHLSKAGIYPQTAWKLACDSVPNLAMRDRLLEAGQRMNSNTKLSDVVFGSKIFPQEFAPIIATGEMVGNIEGALNQLEQASKTEFDVSTSKARIRSVSFGCTGMLIVSGIMIIVLAQTMYRDLVDTVLKDFQVPEFITIDGK